jgi:hypothetical protein
MSFLLVLRFVGGPRGRAAGVETRRGSAGPFGPLAAVAAEAELRNHDPPEQVEGRGGGSRHEESDADRRAARAEGGAG